MITVWLVVMDQGGVFGIYLDEDRAHEVAAAIEGLVVKLPNAVDYRS